MTLAQMLKGKRIPAVVARSILRTEVTRERADYVQKVLNSYRMQQKRRKK